MEKLLLTGATASTVYGRLQLTGRQVQLNGIVITIVSPCRKKKLLDNVHDQRTTVSPRHDLPRDLFECRRFQSFQTGMTIVAATTACSQQHVSHTLITYPAAVEHQKICNGQHRWWTPADHPTTFLSSRSERTRTNAVLYHSTWHLQFSSQKQNAPTQNDTPFMSTGDVCLCAVRCLPE